MEASAKATNISVMVSRAHKKWSDEHQKLTGVDLKWSGAHLKTEVKKICIGFSCAPEKDTNFFTSL